MDGSDRLSRRRFLGGAMAAGAAGVLVPSLVTAGQGPADAGDKTPAWQIGCYTRPWAAHEYRVAFDAIAEAGLRYVGLMTTKSATGLVISAATPVDEARQVGEEAAKRGLAIASVYGGDIPVRESLQAAVEALRRLVDNCEAARAAGLLLGGTGDAALQDTYYKAVAECCDYAAAKHVGLSAKPHGGLNATGPQCRKIIERVGHKNLRLWYDPGNIYYYSDGQLDPVADAATVDGLVVGMSVKDYKHPRNVDVTPGTGQVNFPAVLARLRQGGFTQGPLIVETLAPGDPAQTLAEARKARRFLEELTGQKG